MESDFKNIEWLEPADTAVTSFATCTGLKRSVVVPSPSWPDTFQPTAQRVLSDFKNMVWCRSADTAVTPLATCTGLKRFSVVPSPCCPYAFSPTAQRVLSDFKNMVWGYPADTAVTLLLNCARSGVLLQEARTSPRARTGASFIDFFMLNTVPRLLQLTRVSRCVSVCGQVHVLVVSPAEFVFEL